MVFLFYSCSKTKPEIEVISIEDLLEETTEEVKEEEKKIEIPSIDGTFISEISQKLYENYSFESHEMTTLIDRFSFESTEKSIIAPLSDSTAKATFFKYSFSDTSSTNNAFNNWLACFGPNCEEILLSENKGRVEESPLWCGVYERDIIIIKFSSASLKYKNELKQTIFQTTGKPLKYTLNVTENNQLKWD